MSGRLVVRRAALAGALDATFAGALVDVTLVDGRIAAVTPSLAGRTVGGDEVIDADGGTVLPGLHDHHLHLVAMAAARTSVAAGPPDVRDAAGLAAALGAADAATPPGAWLRAVGYHESVAGDLDGAALDRLAPLAARPVRVQHRSGACWIVNAAGAAALDLAAAAAAGIDGVERAPDGTHTGRLFGLDDWLRQRLATAAGADAPAPDLAGVAAELASYGVTGVTDATPTERAADVELLAGARVPLRIVLTGGPGLPVSAAPGLARGPVKLYPADHALPTVDALAAQVRAARALGRTVAVHCVTLAALVVAIAALDDAGGAVPGDRIEHGAVVPLDLAAELAARAVTVVTQPAFVHARGDAYLADVDPADREDLWRCAGLLTAGVRVAGSSDAPFGPADPWRAMRTAIERTTSGGRPLGPHEALAPLDALALYLGPPEDPGGAPRRVAPGERADLCVLDGPLEAVLRDPDARHVAATVAAGHVTFRR